MIWSASTIWWALVLVMAVVAVPTALALVVDPRMLDGALIWAKPLKFQLAVIAHFTTLALVLRALSPEWRGGAFVLTVAVLSSAAALFEVGYIALQAWRGMRSHFNLTTPLYAALYTAMASGAVVIVASAGALGIVAAIDREAALPLPVRIGVAVGFIGGTVLTMITAFTIGSRLSPFVGTEAPDAPRMWGTGWALTIGDLRVAHFLATHMIQAIPLFSLVAMAALPAAAASWAVIAAGVAWTALTLVVWKMALAGLPIVGPGL